MLDQVLARLTRQVVARKVNKAFTLKLEIQCGNEETMRTMSNLLAAISHNCAVGHSATVAAFFDGDGADSVHVKGLPECDGGDMANACSAYGDGLFALIGPHTATAYNTVYKTIDGEDVQVVRRTSVWPKQKE